MARIAESELERLKAEVSVARLAEASGIKLEKRGKDMVGPCPFHADDTPSLTITPDKNLFHCFVCGVAGGPIDWVMKRNGVSFRHAVELLREGLPGVTDETVKHSTVRALPPPVSLDADDQALLDQVIGYYHDTLKRSPEALGYLQRRGIGNGEAVERFKLGFADRTLGLRLPEKNRKAGAEIRTRLERIGLYRESGHEHFNGSLVMPVLDEQCHATEVYGRKITERLRPGTPLHLYLPGPHRGVWNLDGLKESGGEIILCEALIDALTFWVAGYRNVTAAYGVEGFTADHLAAFKRFDIRRILIAFDRDEAGERGTAKVAERLLAEGFDCYRVLFPKGLDANAYALKLTPASKSLGLLIRKAEWLGKGAAPTPPTSSPIIETGPAIEIAAKEEMSTTPIAADEIESEIADAPSSSSLAADLESVAGTQSDQFAPLPASVLPASLAAEPDAEVNARDITISFAERRYRVRGFDRNLAVDVMKVNLLARCADVFHVDTFDLYSAKARGNFIQMAAGELRLKPEIVKADLGKVLLKLESLQDERIAKTLKPEPAERAIDRCAHEAALAYGARARDPLPVLVPMARVLHAGNWTDLTAVVERRLPRTDRVADWPAYAFDPIHTRIGRRAVELWVRSYLVKQPFSVGAVAAALWNGESAACSRWLSWDLGAELKQRAHAADLHRHGVRTDQIDELGLWIVTNWPALTCARRAALSSAIGASGKLAEASEQANLPLPVPARPQRHV
jgi:DNA primase catalytic core